MPQLPWGECHEPTHVNYGTCVINKCGKSRRENKNYIYIYISISLPVNCYTEGWMHEAAFHRFGKFWKMLDPSDRLCALQLHSDLTS